MAVFEAKGITEVTVKQIRSKYNLKTLVKKRKTSIS
jgi:hypothetical protein